jgi:DNA-binding response OmpR family regulator
MPSPPVWIFEDDPDHCDLIAAYCGLAGVTFAPSYFRNHRDIDRLFLAPPAAPQAAIVDSNLTGIDGVAVIRKLREAYGAALPIIFYSSTPVPREQDAAVRAGADAVLIKDFGRDGLPETLARLAGLAPRL